LRSEVPFRKNGPTHWSISGWPSTKAGR